jgi:hypothetical protein
VQRRVEVLRALRYATPTVVVEIDADQLVDRVIRDTARAVWARV